MNSKSSIVPALLYIGVSAVFYFLAAGDAIAESKRELRFALENCERNLKRINKTFVFDKESTVADFAKWWKETEATGTTLGIRTMRQQLQHIRPTEIKKGYETYSLFEDVNTKIYLDVPGEKWGDVEENIEETGEPRCMKNKSFLRISGYGSGTQVDLNPYCSEGYTMAEVDIRLYWLPLMRWPLIEVITNGAACVPAALYQFTETTKAYKKVAEWCGG